MQPPDALPVTWQRLLALSGVVFAVALSGRLVRERRTDAPDYGATDQAWTDWADDNQWNSRISAFAMLLAGFVLLALHGDDPKRARGCGTLRLAGLRQLARVAFAGAVTGMAGMAMAIRHDSQLRVPTAPTSIPS